MEKETAEKFIFEVKCFSKICGKHALTALSAQTLPASVKRNDTADEDEPKREKSKPF